MTEDRAIEDRDAEDRDIDTAYDVAGFVAELRRLADALEHAHAFTITLAGEDVTIPQDAQFSIAHERGDGAVELEFQVTWSIPVQTGETASAEDAAGGLEATPNADGPTDDSAPDTRPG